MALNPMGKKRGQLENSNCPSIIPFRVIYYLWEKKIYQRGELLWMLKIWNTMELNALVF